MIEYIEKKWIKNADFDVSAGISAWDSVVEDYVYDGTVRLDNNPFLLYLQEKVPLSEEMTVLDVGCGAGAYSFALAEKTAKTVGVDYSPKMIEAAKETALQLDIDNAEFMICDWHDCNDRSFDGKFDLVFAHTTPAIADCKTFVKMINASKKYGLFCKPARRTDEVFDRIREIAGVKTKNEDEAVLYAFDILWHYGFNPEISYHDTVWESKKTAADAEKWYLGRLKGSALIDETTESIIKDYIRSVSKDGIVEETIRTTLVNIFWEVKK